MLQYFNITTMRLVEKNQRQPLSASFNAYERNIPCFDDAWHYHSQYELIYITRSSGMRFVGDSVSKFLPGDLVLTGPNLPHVWRNNPSYYKGADDREVKTIIIKFENDFLGESFFNSPEFVQIHEMLDLARRGLFFGHNDEVRKDISQLLNKDGVERVLSLLGILNKLSKMKDRKVLSSSDMTQVLLDKKNRLDSIIKHISDNYASPLTLEDVSSLACMTPNSFCRYFKNMTNKPFSTFLNEVRIQNAMRLISIDKENIKDISFDVGYKSVTNFNRQFKKVVDMTPMQYRQSLRLKATAPLT